MARLSSLYPWEWTLGKTIWNKTEVLLGMSWGTIWELGEAFGNLMGTCPKCQAFGALTLLPRCCWLQLGRRGGSFWNLLDCIQCLPWLEGHARGPSLVGSSFWYLFSQKGLCVSFFSNFVINEKTICFLPSQFLLIPLALTGAIIVPSRL